MQILGFAPLRDATRCRPNLLWLQQVTMLQTRSCITVYFAAELNTSPRRPNFLFVFILNLEGLWLMFDLKNRHLWRSWRQRVWAEREQSEACDTVYIAAVSSPQSTPFTQVTMWSSVNAKMHSKAAVSALAEVVIVIVWTKRSWLMVWTFFLSLFMLPQSSRGVLARWYFPSCLLWTTSLNIYQPFPRSQTHEKGALYVF